MSWLDLGLIVTLLGFVWGGWVGGLIQGIGGLVGLLFGQFLALRLYQPLGHAIAPLMSGNEVAANIVAFIALFLFISKIIGILFWVLNRVFHLIAIVPGMKLANRLAGAVLGFIEGALFIGVVLQMALRLPIPADVATQIQVSAVAAALLHFTGWLVPLLPKALKDSQSAIDRVLPR